MKTNSLIHHSKHVTLLFVVTSIISFCGCNKLINRNFYQIRITLKQSMIILHTKELRIFF